MKEIHASQIRLARNCIEALNAPQTTSEGAQLGKAVHYGIASELSPNRKKASIPSILASNGLPLSFAKEYNQLVWACVQWLSEYIASNDYEIIGVETAGSINVLDFDIVGTADVLLYRYSDDNLVAVDWKTGRIETDNHDQMMAYLSMNAMDNRTCQYIVFNPREKEANESERMNKKDLTDWQDMLINDLRRAAKRSGTHCKYCGYEACKNRNVYLTDAIELANASVPLSEQSAVACHEYISTAISILEKYKDAIDEQLKDFLKISSIEMPDGRIVTLEKKKTSPTIDTEKMMIALAEILNPDEIAQTMTFSITKVRDALAEKIKRHNAETVPDERIDIKSTMDETLSNMREIGAYQERDYDSIKIKHRKGKK